MKFRHRIEGSSGWVQVTGDLDSAECNCLQAFWDCHVPDDLAKLELDLAELDSMDGESVAVMVNLIRQAVDGGAAVRVVRAPQMLAHTLYKIGMLIPTGVELVEPRVEEPYG